MAYFSILIPSRVAALFEDMDLILWGARSKDKEGAGLTWGGL